MRTTVGLMLAATVVAMSAQQQTPPQFRAGVEVTRIEVTVLDKRTRAPIKGLTADDFVVRVNGRVQPIVSLAEVTVPGVTSAAAPGMAEAARDVTSNELTAPRIFVLIMSDAVGGMDPYYRATGKAIAHRFIDQLGPEDLASVGESGIGKRQSIIWNRVVGNQRSESCNRVIGGRGGTPSAPVSRTGGRRSQNDPDSLTLAS